MATAAGGLFIGYDDIWLLDGVRTAFADYNGVLGLVSPTDLGIKVARAVFERAIPRKTADYAVTMDELDHNIRLRMMQNTAEETITHRHSLKEYPATGARLRVRSRSSRTAIRSPTRSCATSTRGPAMRPRSGSPGRPGSASRACSPG